LEETMAFEISTPAFQDGSAFPKLHTCEGADLSPALEWEGEPEGTKSFALIVDDPDAPAGIWNHWLLWDVPAGARALAQGCKPGATGVSGTNDFGRPGYGGPCPPRGHGPHRYFFKLFALDVASVGLAAGAKRRDLDRALEGHVLGQTSLMGRYERR
jgi:Raf kinase inhibitor-like YbhB/YbcL family protein